MSITQDGNSFTWDGTVTVTWGTDLNTGVATLVLTPNGGVGNLPVLATGDSGPPPTLRNLTVNQVPYGTTVPASSWTLVTPGGAGVAAVYDATIYVNSGEPGASGTMSISGATDLEGGPPGSGTDGYIIRWVNADSKWKIVAELCGDSYNSTSFTAISGAASPATLAEITIPSQPFDWRPDVEGFAVPTGTANTHVDLVCRLNSTTGDQVGYGLGVTGAGSTGIPAFPVTMIRSFGGAIGSGSYGRVTKGNAANLYFLAIETAATGDSFSVPASPCSFTVKVDPIPGTS